MSQSRLNEVLTHLQPPRGKKPWHGGATVLGAVRGVPWEAAMWRPAPDRHSIWELALHVAYWEYAVRRRLTKESRGRFPRSPSDWPAPPETPSPEGWRDDQRLVRKVHDELLVAVSSFEPAAFDASAGGEGRYTFGDLLFGIVLHNTYHAGQIQIMKRLHRSIGDG